MTNDDLSVQLTSRAAEIENARRKGIKVVGYLPGNYVPEELIYASGAIPICLAFGGNRRATDMGLSLLPSVICPFARGLAGEKLLAANPFYRLIDLVIAPITCQHLKKVAELWEYDGDVEVFKLGVPHKWDGDAELIYYADRLRALRDRLEDLTGNKVTDQAIVQAIDLYNRMRGGLRKISLSRKNSYPLAGTLDFVKLNHASLLGDPPSMVEEIETTCRGRVAADGTRDNGLPLLLIGPNLAIGDYELLELVESTGSRVVVEEICEGIRSYWQDIPTDNDPILSLARGYLVDRNPCAFMRNSAKKRLDFALHLAKDFKITGVIWYQLLCCETYDVESYLFTQRMAEQGIPVLTLESDYGVTSSGQFRVRLEAFVEMLSEGAAL
jgi:benzoyl-CoA reductase/2-hydroxyglutaryl-CoA dehydratase subunit BcrC/BadD/HgdB